MTDHPWRPHDRSATLPDFEELVDVIGTDGLETVGWWPHNILWENVVRWRPHTLYPPPCRICDGTGQRSGPWRTCGACGGSGKGV